MSQKTRWLKRRQRSQKLIADLANKNVEKQLNLYFENQEQRDFYKARVHVIPADFMKKHGEFYGGVDFKKLEILVGGKSTGVFRLPGSGELIKIEGTTNETTETIVLFDGIDHFNPMESTPVPPPNAEYILHLFLRGDDRDAVIGDLIERYAGKYERFGERRAKMWFYSEVLRSLWPLLKRLAARASGLIALGEWIRRHVS